MGKIEDGQQTMIVYYDHPNVNRKRALKPEVGRILKNESLEVAFEGKDMCKLSKNLVVK